MRFRRPRAFSTAGARRQARYRRRANSTDPSRSRRSVLHLVRELRGICSNRSAVAWGAPLIRWSDDGAIVLAARPGVSAERPIFLPSSVSLFDLKARFFVPTRHGGKPPRTGAVKVGRLFGDHPRGLALTVPSTAAPSNAVGLGPQDDDQRGARVRARIYRATTLYSMGPRTRTMMQSCASVAKLRSGGPILCYGVISHGVHRVSATSNRHRRPVTSGRAGPKLLGAFCVLRSLCGTQNDAVRHHAVPHESPQGDQKLARQGHDHGLASAAGVLGAGSEPLRQGAVLLEHEAPALSRGASSRSRRASQ